MNDLAPENINVARCTILANLRETYKLGPGFYRIGKDALRKNVETAAAALFGLHLEVFHCEPDSFEELLGNDGSSVVDYLSLQLQQVGEVDRFGSIPMIKEDLRGFCWIAQFLALRAFVAQDKDTGIRWIRIARAYHDLAQGIAKGIRPRVPVRIVEERFRNPFAIIKRIEDAINLAAQLPREDMSEQDALRVRAAVICGLTGGVVGGHRISQVRNRSPLFSSSF